MASYSVNPYEEDRRRAAAMRGDVTPAIWTLVLYIVLWVPGLVANIVYLQPASRDQRLTGQAPEGKSCLTALLVVFIIIPLVLACMLVAGAGLAGLGSSLGSAR